MSRKHYIAAAALIRDELMTCTPDARPSLEAVAEGLASLFASDPGSHFQPSRFLAACGLS